MFNYVDIIRRQNELEEKKENLHRDRINLVTPLYNLQNQYPEVLKSLPDNFDSVDPYRFDVRLEALTEDVEISSIEEPIKENIINLINDIRKELKVINNKQRIYDRFLEESVKLEKLKRENYLEGIYNETAEIKENIERLKKEIEDYKKEFQLGIDKNYDKEILNTFNSVIIRKENEIRNLKYRVREIYKEPGLLEEITLYKEEKDKLEKKHIEPNEEERKKLFEEKLNSNKGLNLQTNGNDNEITENLQENKEDIDKIIEDVKELISEDKNSNEETNKNDVDFVLVEDETPEEKSLAVIEHENNNPQTDEEKVEAVKPEKPKKVKSKHKASPELIKKIKKYGAVGLGIASIGIAITTLILNPAIAGWALGAGLILSETKESLVKK